MEVSTTEKPAAEAAATEVTPENSTETAVAAAAGGEEVAKEATPEKKGISGHEKRRRKNKNKRRCKNKFKSNITSEAVETFIKSKETLELVKNVDGPTVLTAAKPTAPQKETVPEASELNESKMSKTEQEDEEEEVAAEPVAAEPVLSMVQEQLNIINEFKTTDKDGLKQKLMMKLLGSRFRFINEQLYTSNSEAAQNLFANDPKAFEVYHQGFVHQVTKWPVNPLDLIVQWLKSKPKTLVVADFGCGEAMLAARCKQKVHSFDLVALNDRVTVCDIAHTPLADASVDVVVCSLSLMGTNCQDFVVEANRVLKVGGIFKVAEVASRFKSTKMFVNDMKSLSFSLRKKDLSNQSYFYIFEFTKGKSLNAKTAKKEYQGLKFGACLYKKR